jgi:hypothetical protein
MLVKEIANAYKSSEMSFGKLSGEVKLSDLVFVDEAGVNIAMSRLYARAKKGQRAHGQRPDGRGKNVTMIGAMGATETVRWDDL